MYRISRTGRSSQEVAGRGKQIPIRFVLDFVSSSSCLKVTSKGHELFLNICRLLNCMFDSAPF